MGLAVMLLSAFGARASCDAQPAPGRSEPLQSYVDSIPGTLVRFAMVSVPGGGGPPFWIGRTEVTWNAYDVFAFRLDLTAAQVAAGFDAESRPSRPYGAPDRGFGHDGFPAIGVTYHAAAAYATWLSKKTGRKYRLPTDAEWTRAAAGQAARPSPNAPAAAWHAGNAGGTTHRVATARADALGLHDMFGNVSEWVTGASGTPLVRGGSYVDPPAAIGIDARAVQRPDWNVTDPQMPKSLWWLSDAPFVGFRLVCEP